MQLKVNRHRQKQEKVHFYPFSSSFLTRGFVYRRLWSHPPFLPSPATSPMWVLCISWQRDAGTQYWRWAAAAPQSRLLCRWSQKIFISNWIFPSVRYLLNYIWGQGLKVAGVEGGPGRRVAEKTIESVREEPNAHQINSSRRGEVGPGWGLGDTCLSDRDYFPGLPDALPPF